MLDVVNNRLEAGLSGDLGNTRAHGAGAEDGDFFRFVGHIFLGPVSSSRLASCWISRVHPSTSLRTNEQRMEIVGHFPFVLSLCRSIPFFFTELLETISP